MSGSWKSFTLILVVVCFVSTCHGLTPEPIAEDRIDGFNQNGKPTNKNGGGYNSGYGAQGYGGGGIWDGLVGFKSVVLILTLAALLGTIALLLLGGGSYVTINFGRKKRDLDGQERRQSMMDLLTAVVRSSLDDGVQGVIQTLADVLDA